MKRELFVCRTANMYFKGALCVLISLMMVLSGIAAAVPVFAEDENPGSQTEMQDESEKDEEESATGKDGGEEGDKEQADEANNQADDQEDNDTADDQEESDSAENQKENDPAKNKKEADDASDDAKKGAADEEEQEDDITDGVAAIGDTQYLSLQDAVDAAKSGETVKLLKDVKENVEIKAGSDMVLTLDLDGHTLTPADPSEIVIYVDGGKDFTLKNGKVKGSNTGDMLTGAVHITSKNAKVDSINFEDNMTGLSCFFSATMVDDYHFEKRDIKIYNCKFHGSGYGKGYAASLAGYSVDMDNCTFYNNEQSLNLYSRTPDNDVVVEFSITNTRFANNSGRVINAGMPSSEHLYMYNVYINNNKLGSEEKALVYIYGEKTGNIGSGLDMYWCKVYGNSGAKHTLLVDSSGGMNLYGVTIENNSAEVTGAACATQGVINYNQYTVVRNNVATGSDERACGGIAIYGGVSAIGKDEDGTGGSYEYSDASASIMMRGGALYDNTSPNAQFEKSDLLARPKCYTSKAISPTEFEGHSAWNPVDKDFTGYKWIEQVADKEENIPAMFSEKLRIYKIDKPDEEAKAAKAAKKAAESVYIDGVSGSDEGDGTKENPVKTFARAKEILEEKNAKTILVLNKVTVQDEQEWSLPEGTNLEREKDYNGILVEVAADGKLTLKDLTVDGGANEDATNSNSLFKIYGELNVEDGTVLENNDPGTTRSRATLLDIYGNVNINGGTLRGGTSSGEGVSALVLYRGAKVNMTGGVIRDTVVTPGNATETTSDRYYTGAVLVKNGAVFDMSGGSIRDNESNAKLMKDTPVEAQPQYTSGGIVVLYNGTVNISGNAEIKNNRSKAGGAIFLANGANVNISGGTISDNYATKLGGAIITAGLDAKLNISGGNFLNNEAGLEGGAIWLYSTETVVTGGTFRGNKASKIGGAIGLAEENTCYLVLKNAIIRNNKANVAGGGIWVCPTGGVTFDGGEAIAIYDNVSDGAGDDFASTPVDRNVVFRPTRTFGIYLSDTTLGDQRVAWYNDGAITYGSLGLCDVDPNVPRYDPENPGERVFLLTDKNGRSAVKAVVRDDARKVFDKLALDKIGPLFEENYSARGGAIGGNSNIINTTDYRNPVEEELKVTKKWDEDIDKEEIPEKITVELLLDGKVIDSLELTPEKNWQGSFRGLIKEYLEAGRYSVREVNVDGFVATVSEIVNVAEEEDLTHVWEVSITNSRPVTLEEYEDVDEGEDQSDVKGDYEETEDEMVETEVKSEVKDVKTGDSNMSLMFAIVLGLAAATLIIMIARRKNI